MSYTTAQTNSNYPLINRKKKQFTLEITTSALCNLNCVYCFEGEKTNKQRLDDKVEILKQKIYELLNSSFFTSNYEVLNVSFWGGEPTLNENLIINIMQEFQNRNDIEFHLYTNGYHQKRLFRIVDSVDTKKLAIQISYDGKKTNDIFRLSLAGQPTSEQVIGNVILLAERGLVVSLKATVPIDGIKNMYSCWQDYKNIHSKIKSVNPNLFISYAPTLDYYKQASEQELRDSIAEFRVQVLKIAKEEIDFFREHGRHLCSWFGSSDSRINCAAGAQMHAVDVDGKTYTCHGALYSSDKRLMEGSDISKDTFVADVELMSKKYQEPIKHIAEECKRCVATVCIICPVVSLSNSKKGEHFERWTDRWVNNLCGFFKVFGEIDRTVQSHLSNFPINNTDTTTSNKYETHEQG